jgi:hypothetical protein
MIETKEGVLMAAAAAIGAFGKALFDYLRGSRKDFQTALAEMHEQLTAEESAFRAELKGEIERNRQDLQRAFERVRGLEDRVVALQLENMELRRQLELSKARVSELERCLECRQGGGSQIADCRSQKGARTGADEHGQTRTGMDGHGRTGLTGLTGLTELDGGGRGRTGAGEPDRTDGMMGRRGVDG